MNAIYGGIDLGTQGVRVSLFDATGALKAAAQRAWPIPDVTSDLHEQDAQEWWKRLLEAGDEAFASLTAAERDAVSGLAVASTSGSLLVCDAAGRPLRPAILYSDRRSLPESAACNEASGLHFRPTFSLPKLLWVRAHEPEVWKQARRALHPADWLTGQLSGQWGRSDETNVLISRSAAGPPGSTPSTSRRTCCRRCNPRGVSSAACCRSWPGAGTWAGTS